MRDPRQNSQQDVKPVSRVWLLWLGLAVAYLASSISGHRGIALAVVGTMAGVAIGATGRRLTGMIVGMALAGACLVWSESLLFVAYAPPIMAFAFMALFFLATLRPGIEPLIARVAKREHPELPVPMAEYARNLTWVWSICFVLLGIIALVLAPIMSFDQWSRWVQGLGYVLPLALFLGEYSYRLRRFNSHHHASLAVLIMNIILVVKDAAVKPVEDGSEIRGDSASC